VPRDLADVLHYFLPHPEEGAATSARSAPREVSLPAALPTLALPVGERDVVRAALAWNLTVEIARLGGCATLVTRAGPEGSALWPDAGHGPVGTQVVHTAARGLGELYRRALDVAVARSLDAGDGGVVLVCVPPAWLRPPRDGRGLLRWVLLLSTADRRELMETYAIAKPLLAADPEARVGVTIHGARRIVEAERAFHHLARVAARHLGRAPISYGLLVDDLHVYRAIVARRPIGIEHPQAPAARALRDVATLVLEDARKAAVA
jgi:hypothetical protein